MDHQARDQGEEFKEFMFDSLRLRGIL